MDFDEKINLNVNGKVGDKVNMNLNYNTDATFDFDTQNFKLKYEGKEDEIIKLVEGGNVSFPSNNSLVQGATSLFGIRTDMQFGKLKLQTVLSQKKSSNKSVSSRGGKQLTPFEIDATEYEDNRHFFLSQYFRTNYDAAMKSLPNLTTGITINRVEIWVTNKTGTTSNTRNIVALTDLGENTKVSRTDLWGAGTGPVPANNANTEYATIAQGYPAARNIDQVTSILDGAGQAHRGNQTLDAFTRLRREDPHRRADARRTDHADGDCLTVAVARVACLFLNRMGDSMTEVQDAAQTALALILTDDVRLDLAGARDHV